MSIIRKAIEGCLPITLDGEPARLWRDRDTDWLQVERRDGKGGRVEFADETAKRVLTNHCNFKSE